MPWVCVCLCATVVLTHKDRSTLHTLLNREAMKKEGRGSSSLNKETSVERGICVESKKNLLE